MNSQERERERERKQKRQTEKERKKGRKNTFRIVVRVFNRTELLCGGSSEAKQTAVDVPLVVGNNIS